MDYYLWIPLVAVVFFGGFIGSMMSGGSILVFTILTFLDMPIKTAIGTLKFTITILALFSAATFLKGGAVNLKLTPSLAISSILGSILGAHLIISMTSNIVNITVILLICLGTIISLTFDKLKKEVKVRNKQTLPIFSGFLLGSYIGMLGIASAIITISMLIILFRLDILQANGTSKMIIFANNLVACVTYSMNNSVDFLLGTLLSIPIALGSWAGAKTALKMESFKLRIIFIATAVLTIVKLINEII